MEVEDHVADRSRRPLNVKGKLWDAAGYFGLLNVLGLGFIVLAYFTVEVMDARVDLIINSCM